MRTAEEIIKEIVEFLNAPNVNGEGRKLWYVLTALRGPDVDSFGPDNDFQGATKSITTASLRGAIGLTEDNEYFHVNTKPLVLRKERNHFNDHFNYAVEAIKDMNFKKDDDANSI